MRHTSSRRFSFPNTWISRVAREDTGSVMGGVWIKTDFLDEMEELRLERQNTMKVGWMAPCGLGWLGWFGHCPKAGKVEDPGAELPTVSSINLRHKAGH